MLMDPWRVIFIKFFLFLFKFIEVMEIGSHDKLIRHKDGLYTSLDRLQQAKPNEVSNTNAAVTNILSPPSNTLADMNNNSGRQLSVTSHLSSTRQFSSSVQPGTTPDNRPPPTSSFRRLIALNQPEWKQAVLGCLSAVLFGAVQPIYAFSMGSMVSVYFSVDHDEIRDKTRTYALCFLGLAVFSLLVNISQHYSFAYMGEYLTKRIRERMLSKILTFEVGWFNEDENSSGAICSRLAKDANVVNIL